MIKNGAAVLAIVAALAAAGCTPSNQGNEALPTKASSASPTATAGISELPGTVFYLSPGLSRETGTFTDKVTLFARKGNEAPRKLGTFVAGGDRLLEITLTVSPDGSHAAWLAAGGQLMISEVDGTNTRILASSAGIALCARPIWTQDSQRVIFGELSDGPAQIVNIDGTDRKPVKTPYPCNHVSLLDGKRLAWSRNEGDKPYVMVGDMTSGTTERFLASKSIVEVVAISPDASRAVVNPDPPSAPEGTPQTDQQKRFETYPERAINGVLIDIATGTALPAPVPGDIIAAEYQKDGSLLLRTVVEGKFWLTIVNGKGEVLAKTAETAELTKHNYLRYVP